MNWTQIVIAIVAILGFGTSIYNLVVDIKRNRFDLRVTLTNGYICPPGGSSAPVLMVDISNIGNRLACIKSCGFILPSKMCLTFTNPYPHATAELPYDLLGGKNFMFLYPVGLMADTLRKDGFGGTVRLRGFYKDAIGNTYRSKPLSFDIDKSKPESETEKART
jgi:hypothetical protein